MQGLHICEMPIIYTASEAHSPCLLAWAPQWRAQRHDLLQIRQLLTLSKLCHTWLYQGWLPPCFSCLAA